MKRNNGIHGMSLEEWRKLLCAEPDTGEDLGDWPVDSMYGPTQSHCARWAVAAVVALENETNEVPRFVDVAQHFMYMACDGAPLIGRLVIDDYVRQVLEGGDANQDRSNDD